MSMSESRLCHAHADRAIRLRRERMAAELSECATAKLAAMLSEGKLIDEVLSPLKLDHFGKLEYIANNSVLLKSSDGHEAIHLVWAPTQVICIHRLLSKEFRTEFQAQWLGVWVEPIDGREKNLIEESFLLKVKYREQLRLEVGTNSEIQFASSEAAGIPVFATMM